eukprot:GILI01010811.1.p1 GENE.GILI01010811.1~~GILI01010811.1.p1  ORF type:complete len:315 (-),score=64.15 GILI01010811.1:103-1047(-)
MEIAQLQLHTLIKQPYGNDTASCMGQFAYTGRRQLHAHTTAPTGFLGRQYTTALTGGRTREMGSVRGRSYGGGSRGRGGRVCFCFGGGGGRQEGANRMYGGVFEFDVFASLHAHGPGHEEMSVETSEDFSDVLAHHRALLSAQQVKGVGVDLDDQAGRREGDEAVGQAVEDGLVDVGGDQHTLEVLGVDDENGDQVAQGHHAVLVPLGKHTATLVQGLEDSDGFAGGEVIYHGHLEKALWQVRDNASKVRARKAEKLKRRAEQDSNVAKKRERVQEKIDRRKQRRTEAENGQRKNPIEVVGGDGPASEYSGDEE